MTDPAWRLALLCAVAVEAAAGLLAVAAATGFATPRTEAIALFVSCAGAAGLVDIVLVQGWIWRPGRLAIVPLMLRGGGMLMTLGAAAFAAVATAFAGLASGLVNVPVLALAGFVGCFGVAGAVSGFGASLVNDLDRRDGMTHGRRRSHVIAGVIGALTVLGAAAVAAGVTDPLPGSTDARPLPWPLWGLASAALAFSGGLHHWLLIRDAQRAGSVAPANRTVVARTMVACTGLLAGAVLIMASV